MNDFQTLYDTILSDPAFRKYLATDPSGALKSIDIEPTPEVLVIIVGIIDAIKLIEKELSNDFENDDLHTCAT